MKILITVYLFLLTINCLAGQKELDTTGFSKAIKIPTLANSGKVEQVASLSQRQVDTINHIKIEYTKFAYDYKKGVFQWQLLSSKIIFCVVVVVVFMGLYLSYMQFRMSAQRFDKVHERHQKLIENPLTTTKLEISRDGIKVDSAVIGLIILVISIVFFFLYLRFVFPIIDT